VAVHADGAGGRRRYTLVAGLLGVAQEPGGLGIFPRVGWALRLDPVLTSIDGLRARMPPVQMVDDRLPAWAPEKRPSLMPAALRALYGEFGDEGADLGGLVVRPRHALVKDDHGKSCFVRFADLPDGAGLAYIETWSEAGAVVEVPAQASSRPFPVIARSVLELFERLASEPGLYFRKPGFQPEEMVAHSAS